MNLSEQPKFAPAPKPGATIEQLIAEGETPQDPIEAEMFNEARDIVIRIMQDSREFLKAHAKGQMSQIMMEQYSIMLEQAGQDFEDICFNLEGLYLANREAEQNEQAGDDFPLPDDVTEEIYVQVECSKGCNTFVSAPPGTSWTCAMCAALEVPQE